MPHQWRLHLRPTSASYRAAVTPAQLHGLACALLEDAGTDHHRQDKPFTITPLTQHPNNPDLAELHLGWLDDTTVPAIHHLTGQRVRLGHQYFTVHAAHHTPTPYEALLATTAPARRAEYDFRSATYFNRRGHWLPLPDPYLLLTGLIRRWQAFAPNQLPEHHTKTLLEAAALSAHDIHTIPVDLGPALRIGFTGQAAITLTSEADTETASTFAALCRYAQIAGTGAQTTHGLGWTTVHLHSPPRRNNEP